MGTRYISHPGPPAAPDRAEIGDVAVDSNGNVWVCTASGRPGTWNEGGGSAGKINTTTVVGNATATTVLTGNTTNAAEWIPCSKFVGKIVAGSGISISPATGQGTVTVTATGVAGGTHVSSFITTNVAVAATTATEITSVSLTAGTWRVSGQVSLKWGATTTAVAVDIAVTTTANSMATALGGAHVFQGGTANVTTVQLNFSCVVTVTATTTLYLNAETGDPLTALAAGAYATRNITGLVCNKL